MGTINPFLDTVAPRRGATTHPVNSACLRQVCVGWWGTWSSWWARW